MRKTRRSFTLLEIMIVIFLIGLIGSVIGYSMKGSMDEGRAFKTKQAKARIKDLLELELAKGKQLTNMKQIEQALRNTGIVKNVDKLVRDGWGEKMTITVAANGKITVISPKYQAYKASKQ